MEKTVVGKWFVSDQSICENTESEQVANEAIVAGKFIEVVGSEVPAGYTLWLTLGGKKYAKKTSEAVQHLLSKKSELLRTAAARIAAPLLLEASSAAAKRAVAETLGSEHVADVDVLASEMRAAGVTVSGAYDGAHDGPAMHAGAYRAAMERTGSGMSRTGAGALRSGGAEGGCDCKLGAAEIDLGTIKAYNDSINSAAKNKIIDEIVNIAKDVGLKVQGDTHQARIKSLLEAIPAGDKFKADDKAQHNACMAIARAINKIYGNPVINVSLPANVICQQVAELVSSLAAGMHSEFLAVYNDVRKSIRNLEVLKSSLAEDHEQIMNRIRNSGTPELQDDVSSLNDLHKMLLDEIARQIQMLQNLLNISLMPAERDLASLISSQKDLFGYIEKIDTATGTKQFGKVISDVLHGLGVTASYALIVDKALKTVGMTVDEYAKNESVDKLRTAVTKNLMGKKNLSEDDLHRYLMAAELLYKNFYRSKDIAAKLKTGMYEQDEFYGSYSGSDNIAYDGGYIGIHGGTSRHGGDAWGETRMDKQINDRKKLRNLIYSSFHKQLHALFDNMVGALNQLTLKVGTEIPLSEQLNGLRRVMQRLATDFLQRKNLHEALIGYYNDAMSVSKREEVLANFKMLQDQLETLLEMPLYSGSRPYFNAVLDNVKSIVELIHRYTEEIQSKFGRGEHKCPSVDDDGERVGGYDGGAGLEDDMYGPPEMKFAGKNSIHDALFKFDYKYRVAQIMRNLKMTGAELERYGEKYDTLVAKSIADVLVGEKKVYDRLYKEIQDDKIFGKLDSSKYAQGPSGEPGFKDVTEVGTQRDAAKFFLDKIWDTKKRFWATVEAVDAYMKVFTQELVKNPGDIKDIQAILDSVDVISEWYTENTGNLLVSAFEQFPNSIAGVGTPVVPYSDDTPFTNVVNYSPHAGSVTTSTEHYYKIIADAHASTPAAMSAINKTTKVIAANPYLVANPVRGKDAYLALRKALSNLGVLKNLFSVFTHLGNTFGGKQIHTQIFMSPTQMYNNVLDYLTVSAFAQGWDLGDPASDLGGKFYNLAKNEGSANVDFFGSTGSPPYFRLAAYGGVRPGAIAVSVGLTIGPNNLSTVIPSMGGGVTKDQVINYVKMMTNIEEIPAHGALAVAVAKPSPLPAAVTPRPVAEADAAAYHAFDSSTYGMAEGDMRPLLFRKRWGIWMRSVVTKLQDKEYFGFKREDKLFVHVMKAIAAKVLTITGTYDVFSRPLENNSGLGPVRLIMGGAGDLPKVIDGAVALYLRLPLLAQFYRTIFGYDTTDEGDYNKYTPYGGIRREGNLKISLVPDIEGVFSGLINFIFRRNKNVDNTNYSDDDVATLVREVNLIYQKASEKHPNNVVTATIDEFVAEMNRRYAIVSQTESQKYEKFVRQRYAHKTKIDDPYSETLTTENIALLPDEEDPQISRPSGAERLLGTSLTVSEAHKSRFTVAEEDYEKLVKNFRCAIEKFFENTTERHSFEHAITSTSKKLKAEQNDEKKFRIIATLVRGVDVYSKIDAIKYILFHETVVSGLAVLSGVHSILSRFKYHAHALDLRVLRGQILVGAVHTAPSTHHVLATAAAAELTKDIPDGDPFKNYLVDQILALYGSGETMLDNGSAYVAGGIDDNTKSGIKIQAGIAVPELRGEAQLTAADGGVNLGPTTRLYRLLGGAGTKKETMDKLKRDKLTPANLEVFGRYVVNYEEVMRQLVELLFGMCGDFQELVKIQFEDGKLNINYGALKTHIEDMFQHVGYFINVLRPIIPAKHFDRYVDKLVPGSYYWLREQIMEKIIEGRRGEPKYETLDELFRGLSYTFHELTRNYDTGYAAGVAGGAGGVRDYGDILARLAFYDASGGRTNYIAHSSKAKHYNAELCDFMNNPYEGLLFTGEGKDRVLDTRYAARFKQFYTWEEGEVTLNRSCMFSFNQLVAKFIQSFYDTASGKMYAGLINNFANGPFNRAIMDQKYTFPDTVPGVVAKKGTFEIEQGALNAISGISGAIPQAEINAVYDAFTYKGLAQTRGVFSHLTRIRMFFFDTANNARAFYINGGALPSIHGAGELSGNLRVAAIHPMLKTIMARAAARLIADSARLILDTAMVNQDDVEAIVGTPGEPITLGLLLLRYLIGVRSAYIQGSAAAGAAIGPLDLNLTGAGGGGAPAARLAAMDIFRVWYGGAHLAGGAAPAAPNAAYDTIKLPLKTANSMDGLDEDMIASILLNPTKGLTLSGAGAPPTSAEVELYCDAIISSALVINGATVDAARSPAGAFEARPFEINEILHGRPGTHTDLAIVAAAGGVGVGAGGVWAGDGPVMRGIINVIDIALAGGDIYAYFRTHVNNNTAAVTLARFVAESHSVYNTNTLIANHLLDLGFDAAHDRNGYLAAFEPIIAILPFRELNPTAAIHDASTEIFKHVIKYALTQLDDRGMATNEWNKRFRMLSTALKDSSKIKLPEYSKERPLGIVKYDDLLKTDLGNFLATAVPFSQNDVMLCARDDEVNGMLPPKSIEIFGPTPTLATLKSIGTIETLDKRHLMDTDGEHVLFTSLSVILKNLFTSKTSSGASSRMYDNVADVAMYMKEKMRAGLPAFRNLFKALSRRCAFLKRIIASKGVTIDRIGARGGADNPWPAILPPKVSTVDAGKQRYIGLLDSISTGCDALALGCEQVLREIGDDPRFFEMYQGSIKDYKSQNNTDPFMPLSSALYVLKNLGDGLPLSLLPAHGIGSDNFKFNYGIRSLLNNPTAAVQLDHCPGYSAIINEFNLSSDARSQITKDHTEGLFKSYTSLLKWLYELRVEKSLLITPHWAVTTGAPGAYYGNTHINSLVVNTVPGGLKSKTYQNILPAITGNMIHTAPDNTIAKDMKNQSTFSIISDKGTMTDAFEKYVNAPFALTKALFDVVKLTESSFKDDRIKEFVEFIIRSGADKSPETLIAQNIVDLNIVPINIHAMMREVPLVNLYNYSHTFDRLAIDVLYDRDEAKKLKGELCNGLPSPTSARDALLASLINPHDPGYGAVGLYDKHVRGMMAGVGDNKHLGRPKFISDQLFNKVLFGQLYMSSRQENPMGPAAAMLPDIKELIVTQLLAACVDVYLARLDNPLKASVRKPGGYNIKDASAGLFPLVRLVLTRPGRSWEELGKAAAADAGISAGMKKFLRVGRTSTIDQTVERVAILAALWCQIISAMVDEFDRRKFTVPTARNWDEVFAAIFTIMMVMFVFDANWAKDDTTGASGLAPYDTSAWDSTFLTDANRATTVTNIADRINRRAKKTVNAANPGDAAGVTAAQNRYTVIKKIITLSGVLNHKSSINYNPVNATVQALAPAAVVHPADAEQAIHTALHNMATKAATAMRYDVDTNAPGQFTSLHWINENGKVVEKTIDENLGYGLMAVGRMRFSTVLVRNLIFIINLYRIARAKLNKDLNYNMDVVARAIPAIAGEQTEFYGNEAVVSRRKKLRETDPMYERYDY